VPSRLEFFFDWAICISGEGLVPSAVNIFDYAVTVKQPPFTQGKVGTALRLASIESEGALSEIDRAPGPLAAPDSNADRTKRRQPATDAVDV
jgi:hypothetical protein